MTLHCLLTGEGLEDAIYAYEPAYTAGEDGPIVIRTPDAVMEKLASLKEDALERVGKTGCQ